MLISYALDAGQGGTRPGASSPTAISATRRSRCKDVPARGRGRRHLRPRRARPGDRTTPPRTPTSRSGSGTSLKPRLAAERMTTVYETLERPLVAGARAHGAARHQGRPRRSCRRLSRRVRAEARAARGRDLRARRRDASTSARPKQLGDILFGKFGLPGGKKTKTGAWSTGADVLDELAAGRQRARRADPRLAAAVEAQVDLHRRCCRPTSTPRPAASTPPTRSPRPPPAGSPPPTRTCRTSRSAPRKGGKIRTAFVAERGHEARSRPTTARSSSASSPTSPTSRSSSRPSPTASTSTR